MATRWYRAPEIMLNWMHYNQTGDGSPTGCGLRRAGRDPEARRSGPDLQKSRAPRVLG